MKRVLTIISLLLLSFSFCQAQTGKPFFRNIKAMEYGGHNRNFDVSCNDNGQVYVANFEGLLKWNGSDWSIIHTPGISRIITLYQNNDRLWFGGNNVFGYIDKDEEIHYISSDTQTNITFGEVARIYQSGKYIIFEANGFSYFVEDDAIKKRVEIKNKTGYTIMVQGYEANHYVNITDQGLSAIATPTDGLIILNQQGEVVYHLTVEDGLCSNSIESISYDGKGTLWGATSNGLFQVFLSPIYTHYSETDGLFGQVTSILSANNTLYVGTLQGMYILLGNGTFKKATEFDLACWQICQLPDGKIVAATATGLFISKNAKVTQLTQRHTLCVLPLSDGTILTGEPDGMYIVNQSGNSVKFNSIPYVAKFIKEPDGGLWAISFYNDTYYKSPSNNSFSVKKSDKVSVLFNYTDNKGRIWQSYEGNHGLSCNKLSEQEAAWLKLLDDYTVEAMAIDGDIAYAGGNFGIIRIDTKEMLLSRPYPPKLYIRNLEITASSVRYSAVLDKIDPIGEPQYSYRLHDRDDWSPWTTSGQMDFEHLSIGKYSITVRGIDSFDTIVESDPITFRIKPPFYLKWYAFLFYLCVLGSFSFFYFRFKLFKAKQEQERLERIVNQRTSQLKEAQGMLLRQEREATVGKLTKGLIDRILNPMNYINNFSHLTQDLANDLSQDIEDEKETMNPDNYDDCLDIVDMMKSNLEKIENHGLATTRILKAMEELLKERSSQVEMTDLRVLCNKAHEMCLTYHKEQIDALGMSVEWNIPTDEVVSNINGENLSKAIMSLLTNGFYAVNKKYSKGCTFPQPPTIRLTLAKRSYGGCTIAIYDNGIGIEESIMEKIFDPFFTTKPTSEAPGVGLYLSNQVVQDFGGEIHVESVKDEYSIFTIVLP